MINRESIAKMKDGVVLVNCARGGLMDMQALIEGIESEKIGALGLDTVENEEGIIHHLQGPGARVSPAVQKRCLDAAHGVLHGCCVR